MKKYLVPLIIATVIIGIGLFLILGNKKNDSGDGKSSNRIIKDEVSIVNVNSDSRTYAVMINNAGAARPYQSGLQNAYIVYELIVEGGITRMMALFKDADVSRVGSVRSARHYYLDYVLENDAIYLHIGGSNQALSDIKTLKINDIGESTTYGFYRDQDVKAQRVAVEHTAFVNLNKAMETVLEKERYRTTTTQPLLLDYNKDSISREDGTKANNISIRYSKSFIPTYIYDEENKVYKRYYGDKAHTDWVTKEQYTAKNIIIYDIKNSTIANDDKGRQDLDNIGTGTGKYCTEGLCYDINWSKTSRSDQTKYTFSDGSDLIVNDGNTFIQIYPKSGELTIN